jgi:hypothetical protein
VLSGETMSDDFKVPQSVPQDLLLIQGFVGAPLPTAATTSVLDDSISSSSEEDEASEEEIAANLIKGTATDDDDEVSVTAYVSLPLLFNSHLTKTFFKKARIL